MKLVATLAAGAILAFVGTSAMAQTAAPATTAPAATTTAPAPTTTTTAPAATKSANTMMKKATTATTPAKTAISKACSAQADAKGLHGKERHKFRSDCKKNGGKV